MILYHHYFTLCLLFSSINSASRFSLVESKAQITKNINVLCCPEIDYDSIETAHCNSLLSEESRRRKLDSLADRLLQIILEYFIDDYKILRLISKNFREIYDEMIFAKCWMLFPDFTKETFSYWKEEYLKFQLIPLARFLSSNSKKLIHCYEKSETRLDLTTNYHLRLNAVPFITLIPSESLEIRLKLVNVFLRLRLVTCDIIYNLLFSDNNSISQIWSLGLMTIARELSIHYVDEFIQSIGIRNDGLLRAIRARKYDLSRFIIRFLRSQAHQFTQGQEFYLFYIIGELIRARYWDLLQDLYEVNKNYDYSYHLKIIAENGYVEGLRALSHPAKTEAPKMTSWAAEKGHLAFLQEMDALELLQKSCYPAIHAAAAYGQTECLEFLVSRFGTKYLGFVDENGYMPIHLAAQRFDSETLRAIIRLYPHYEPLSSTKFSIKSPLHEAIRKSRRANIRILLDTFPELINFKDSFSDTVVHMAMNDCDDLLLKELLKLASPEIITAKNILGKTALHMGQDLSNYFEKVELLMKTGLFTGLERDNRGLTPIASFFENLDWKSAPTRSRMMESFESKSREELNSRMMEVFKLKSEEEFSEALRIVRNTDSENRPFLKSSDLMPKPRSRKR